MHGQGSRVAVVGAGAAGLTAAKALREVGMTPVVYEAKDTLGGLWAYRDDDPAGGPAYASLRTNTSGAVTAFSDFPFPRDLPHFPSLVAVEEYLSAYAREFDLLRDIRFNTQVQLITPSPGGRWHVALTSGETAEFDAVLVCTGIFRKRILPDLPDGATWQGPWQHSLDYGSPEPFRGQKVLVVGLGSSAVDIATDLKTVATEVGLSVRRGAWVAPRMVGGTPLDHRRTRLAAMLPARLQARGRRVLEEEYRRQGVEGPAVVWAGANVPFDPHTAPGVVSDNLLADIASRAITAYPAIVEQRGEEVVFADGRRMRPDVTIFCTGYALHFPFLPEALRPWTDPEGRDGLYRLMIRPGHPTLAFVGVCRAQGPIFPIVEMQARWVARLLTGEVSLPPGETMNAEIAARVERQRERRDSTLRVALLPYLDELGGEIGARPRLWKHPMLVRALLAGPPVAAQYRLEGPNRWVGAAAVVGAGG